jgi:ATP-dependent RNA helicase DeaD/ATP-dependent RNA helicase RhlE
MYTNNKRRSFNRGPRRFTGVQKTGKAPRRGQYIDPRRFVKAASSELDDDYSAKNAFADFGIHPLLKSNIAVKGYKVPSEIQDKAIPVGLEGRDIVGIANTGTGKTASFAVPILNRLMHSPTSRALIVAPTRELAIQIDSQIQIYAKHSGLNSAIVVGGLSIGRQTTSLKANPNVIIGTPGRLIDHIKQGNLNLAACGMVVFDEVDRMLDMGFINDVRYILDRLPDQRQSFFFSATMSPEINALIDTFTREAVRVNVKSGETSGNVNQDVVRYNGKPQKIDRLHDLLITGGSKKTLIFGETKYGVERLARELKARGFKAEALHGGKTQGARKRALDSFRNNSIDVLVATDVAARGIDVIDITHVVNFDIPHTYDDYIHRIGRTGRAGRTGQALTFVEQAGSN